MDSTGPRIPGPDGYEPFWDEIAPLSGSPSFTPYYSPDGQPCTLRQYTAWREDKDIRQVALDELRWSRRRGLWISTVYLGLDHGFGLEDGAPPLIYETMAFRRGTFDDADCERWATREQAAAGHEALLRGLTRGLVAQGHTVLRTRQISPTDHSRREGRRKLLKLGAELKAAEQLFVPEGGEA